MGTSSIIVQALQTIDPEMWWLGTGTMPSMVAEQELHTVAEQNPRAIMVYGTSGVLFTNVRTGKFLHDVCCSTASSALPARSKGGDSRVCCFNWAPGFIVNPAVIVVEHGLGRGDAPWRVHALAHAVLDELNLIR